VLRYLDIETSHMKLVKICKLTDCFNADYIDLTTLFESIQENFMIEGDKDINTQRQTLLDQVRNGEWNLANFDVLIAIPNDPVLHPLLQEYYNIITHYFVNCNVYAQLLDDLTEVVLRIP